MSDTLRTFIAIELPESIISFISRIQKEMKSYGFKVKWVRPENIHITLKFLGNIHKADVEKIGGVMPEAVKGSPPISLSAKGICVFPGIKRPRVIWLGLKGQTFELIELQKVIDDALENIGFPKEGRPFKAHLTLARVKGNIHSKKLLDVINKFGESESETFTADKVILFKSDLKPTGAVYTKLHSGQLSVVSSQ